jgi:hypothetical protein
MVCLRAKKKPAEVVSGENLGGLVCLVHGESYARALKPL